MQFIRHTRWLLFVWVVTGFISCINDTGKRDVNPDSIYFDYRVWGDEDAGYVTVRLQYRVSGSGGTTLLLESPVRAELDGMVIKADSSKMNGVYYEVARPVREFTGHHSIVFTDRNGKQYKEEFSFQPISLKQKLPDMINRADLAFELEGLAAKDHIKVMLSDTASFSEGIDRVDTVTNGHVTITREDLQKLTNGPVYLEFSKELERSIRNGSRERGKLYIAYGLKREFELRD